MEFEPDWSEMGLTEDQLFTKDAMKFWRLYPKDEFLKAIIHEIKAEIMNTSNMAKLISNGTFNDLELASKVIIESQDRLKSVVEIIRYYFEDEP